MAKKLILGLLLATAFANGVLGNMVEPESGISFKKMLNIQSIMSFPQEVVGVGIRVKKIGPVKVKVYAAGMYFDFKPALGALMKFGEKGVEQTGEQLAKKQAFFDSIVSGTFGKTVVLNMARGVAKETMVNALSESVKPRMKSNIADVSTFEDMLLSGLSEDGSAKKGMEFAFSTENTKLSMAIDGKKVGVIDSKPLCEAFMSVYLDNTAVSPALKESIANNLCKYI
eukprot:CAMPEP_0113941548 /NCGR_PEP_ID=MMETSP1339-20121228/7440_1 /TAXON_ID=94617 /ORGANISM="Fibrocapsa japonica" /LENGTH=226 /DNA_ID=CAMNT_0000945723 /DNA_START=71 /DNA_END=751 /DNA_ORIENTATION=- /assembly_acc=CAM_ASM_000762